MDVGRAENDQEFEIKVAAFISVIVCQVLTYRPISLNTPCRLAHLVQRAHEHWSIMCGSVRAVERQADLPGLNKEDIKARCHALHE
jgi:hypothetical protein